MVNTQTKNNNLKNQLDLWVEQIKAALQSPQGSTARFEAIKLFCRSFVPIDVNEEDTIHYATQLAEDEVCFFFLNADITSRIQQNTITGILFIFTTRYYLLCDRRSSGINQRGSAI